MQPFPNSETTLVYNWIVRNLPQEKLKKTSSENIKELKRQFYNRLNYGSGNLFDILLIHAANKVDWSFIDDKLVLKLERLI